MERVVHEEGASSAKVPGRENVESRHKRNPCSLVVLFVLSPQALKIAALISFLLGARSWVYHGAFLKQSWEASFPHF